MGCCSIVIEIEWHTNRLWWWRWWNICEFKLNRALEINSKFILSFCSILFSPLPLPQIIDFSHWNLSNFVYYLDANRSINYLHMLKHHNFIVICLNTQTHTFIPQTIDELAPINIWYLLLLFLFRLNAKA